jgi:hypothetical protein
MLNPYAFSREEMEAVNEQMVAAALFAEAWADIDCPVMTLPEWRTRVASIVAATEAA